MATTTTNISLTKPAATDTTKIREDFNDNMDIIDGRFSSTYMAVQAKNAVAITGGVITGITDLVVADGGTGVSTLTDGGVLLGSGTGAITAMAVLADSEMIVGNGTTDPVAESGATLRTSIGLGSVENTALSTWAGTANITTLGTVTTGTLSTGGVLADVTMTLGSDVDGDVYYRASNKLTRLAKGTATQVLAMNAGATAPEWTTSVGYTNLTSFVNQTAWRVFYSNTAGDVTELALGADGTYLKSNGAAVAPTFETPAGAGDVTKVGTPVDSQVGVWTGDGTIEGAASLTYDGANLQLTGDIGSTGTKITKGWFTDLVIANAIILADGTTATTQAGSDNSTKVATTAYADAVAGGASLALDNLASVAINTSLLPGTAGAIDLGSATKEWGNLYLDDSGYIYFGLAQDASIRRSAANQLTVTGTGGVVFSAGTGLTMNSDITLGANKITMTGQLGETAARVSKLWATDIECTNAIAGSITGTAANINCTDNENEALACPIIFVDGATGAQGAETDGDLTYNPSTGTLTSPAFVANGTTAYGINITGANTTAQLYIAGTNILANGEQAIWVNCPSEDGATNGIWVSLGSTVVTGDLTGARIKSTSSAVSGGDASSGQQTRAVYGQAIGAASKHAGLLQGGLFTADAVAGSVTAYNVHVLCGHYSSGASTTIGGDLYVGYLRAQTRSTTPRTVTGHDCLLALENEAIEGSGAVMDSAIRIFDTNVTGDGFTYGIDMSDAVIATADIRLQNGEIISNVTDGTINFATANLTTTGDIGSTGTKITKGWFTDLLVTNTITGSVTGTAAIATTLTITDNESTNESNAILFTANAEQGGGNLAIESDGTLTYNPSTGKITATGFVGALTGEAATVATITGLAPDTATTQATQASITTCANLTSIGTLTDLTVTNAIAGSITGTARGLVSVSNGDITIQPNGTGDTIIYAPADVVTTKTAVATLTIAEAGTVLVSCAAVPYTITLPTASGHTGLRYHFIKTDANYFLITLDGDGGETFNYENSTGTPNTTYARLNTYCAEVTIVSDGSNWQVINEVMGQMPIVRVYMSFQQNNVAETGIIVPFDTEDYDIGSNFDISEWVSGTADENTVDHLVDDGTTPFLESMVGYRVKNTTDTTYAWIIAFVDTGDVELSADIFPLGTEAYQIMNAKFVCPVPGTYRVFTKVNWGVTVANKHYSITIYNNGVNVAGNIFHSAKSPSSLSLPIENIFVCAKDDYIEIWTKQNEGASTADLKHSTTATYLTVELVSKD